MRKFHRTLERQFRRYVQDEDRDFVHERLGKLMGAISDAYEHYDRDRQLQDRSSRMASEELEEANQLLLKLTDTLESKVRERTAHLEEAMEEARQASAAKSLFLANMSHELRTPLNAITGYSEMLLDDLTMLGHSEDSIQCVTRIITASSDLTSMIQDVLDINRIEAGKSSLDMQVCVLDEFMSEICDGAKLQAEEGGVLFQYHLAEHVPNTFVCDPTKMRQILHNILGNAFKFTDRGQSVRLSVDIAGGCVCFEIADEGCGIAPESIGRIFGVFEQCDSSISRNFEGSGLGLAICQRFVELMRGEIDVESTLGEGTVFRIKIPCGIDAKSSVTIGSPTHFLSDQRVLVVEDNKINQDLALRLLRKLHINRAQLASDGREGVEAVRSCPPDLILLDLHMPGMSGFEVLEAVRADPDPKVSQTPVVICTANARKDLEETAYAKGADAFVPKPLTSSLLASALLPFLKVEEPQ